MPYPSLKHYMRLQPLSQFDFLVNARFKSSVILSKPEAVLLSLCGGVYDLDTITHIYTSTFRLDPAKAQTEIQETFDKYAPFLDLLDTQTQTKLFYNPLDFLKVREPNKSLAKFRQESPTHLTMSLTYSCNHRCIYCCNSSGQRRKNELSTEDWLRVVDEAAEMGVVGMIFSGGEPTMHPGFLSIIERAIQRRIYPAISTNGTRLTEPLVEQLARTGADYIHLSMSATTPSLYDEIVGYKGNLPAAQQAIRLLKKYGFYVRVKMVIMPINLGEVENLLESCYELGADFVHLCPFQLTHLARQGGELLLSLDQIKDLNARVQQKTLEFTARPMVVDTPLEIDLRWQKPGDIVRCGGIKSTCTVLPDGEVTHCEVLGGTSEFSIGNVREAALSKIWLSERANQLLVNLPYDRIEEPCKSCEYLAECKTGCYVCSLISSDNPWSVDPRCWKSNLPDNPFGPPLQPDYSERPNNSITMSPCEQI